MEYGKIGDIASKLNNLSSNVVQPPMYKSITDPKREIQLNSSEEETIQHTINALEKSNIDTNKLFILFDDWQSKRTLTTKRTFVSISMIISVASWTGVDYSKLSFFGLKISDGSTTKFLFFVLLIIISSGIFYEISRRIDLSIKKAKISQTDDDLKKLKGFVNQTQNIMENNNINSFRKLYYDFRSAINNPNQTATDTFKAVQFYYKKLEFTNKWQKFIDVAEQTVIYFIGVYAVGALIYQLWKVD